MDRLNSKIVSVSFLLASAFLAIAVGIILEALATSSGWFARQYGSDLVRHGVPVACAALLFLTLQLNSGIRAWANDCVAEVRKVVWPTRQETVAMTTVCCIMLVVAGIAIGVFDLAATQVVKLFLQ